MRKKIAGKIHFLLAICLLNHTVFAEPANLALLKTEIKQYHDQGRYQQELNEVALRAKQYILARVANNKLRQHRQNLAIVLDIDETCLSSYAFIQTTDFAYHPAAWYRYIQSARAQAIKPMLSLYRLAQANGVAVFFITGRGDALKQATIKNLIHAGYTKWTGLYTRPAQDHHNRSVIPFKALTRAKISQQGYVIIAAIGDQYSDLKGGYAEKTFKLPNPYYYID